VQRNSSKWSRKPCTISTPRGLHDVRAVCDIINPRMGQVRSRRRRNLEPSRANTIQEHWMKSAKTFAIALAASALLAGPALAQGTSSQTGTSMQGRGTLQQGAPAGGADEELDAQSGAATGKGGVAAKSGAKGTVGAGSGTRKSTGSEPAPGTKKY
jgi:hypothetical protein